MVPDLTPFARWRSYLVRTLDAPAMVASGANRQPASATGRSTPITSDGPLPLIRRRRGKPLTAWSTPNGAYASCAGGVTDPSSAATYGAGERSLVTDGDEPTVFTAGEDLSRSARAVGGDDGTPHGRASIRTDGRPSTRDESTYAAARRTELRGVEPGPASRRAHRCRVG